MAEATGVPFSTVVQDAVSEDELRMLAAEVGMPYLPPKARSKAA